MSLYNKKVGKFFGRTAHISPIPMVFLSQDRLRLGIRQGYELITAFFIAETDSIKTFEYLLAVDMHVFDPTEVPGPQAYTQLGYFTARIDALKKTYMQKLPTAAISQNDI